jgi:hypothetical protein
VIASFTTTAGLVLALFAALGLGGLLVAIYTATQTRISGMRDRMIEVAELFVGDVARGIALIERAFEQASQSPAEWQDSEIKNTFAELRKAIEAGESRIPRLTILFPGIVSPKVSYDIHEAAFDALQPLYQARKMIETALEDRASVSAIDADRVHHAVWAGHGGFAAYAHEIIWRRRPDRPPSWRRVRQMRTVMKHLDEEDDTPDEAEVLPESLPD